MQLTVPEIKDEMEKTLQWLVPIAISTAKYDTLFGHLLAHSYFHFCNNVFIIIFPFCILLILTRCFWFQTSEFRAHHGFGWVGEWANTG